MGTVLGITLLVIAAIIILLIVGAFLFGVFAELFEFVLENWFILLIVGVITIIGIGAKLLIE